MATRQQIAGRTAESAVAAALRAEGWSIVGRNVRVGRAEIDLVAIDPGPPARLVAVEVRWRRRRDHGRPEETVDRRKVLRLRTAIGTLATTGRLPDGTVLPVRLPAVDLVTVQPDGPGRRLDHLRDVEPD